MLKKQIFNVLCHEWINNKSCEVNKCNLSYLEISEEPAGRSKLEAKICLKLCIN